MRNLWSKRAIEVIFAMTTIGALASCAQSDVIESADSSSSVLTTEPQTTETPDPTTTSTTSTSEPPISTESQPIPFSEWPESILVEADLDQDYLFSLSGYGALESVMEGYLSISDGCLGLQGLEPPVLPLVFSDLEIGLEVTVSEDGRSLSILGEELELGDYVYFGGGGIPVEFLDDQGVVLPEGCQGDRAALVFVVDDRS